MNVRFAACFVITIGSAMGNFMTLPLCHAQQTRTQSQSMATPLPNTSKPETNSEVKQEPKQAAKPRTIPATLTADQRKKVEALVDQLVYEKNKTADNKPVIAPQARQDATAEERKRFAKCQEAFEKLSEMREVAFPVLIEHLDDKRQSINFRNHVIANAVGDACYHCLYYQLQDRPQNYSRYGYSREGKDGKDHPKPYWEGTPFDDAGGLKKWLEVNKKLSYPEMQIKCLTWLLDAEKKIGAPDAESYFRNILPLEIQILKRKKECGEKVDVELARAEKTLKEKDASKIPSELLPEKPQPKKNK